MINRVRGYDRTNQVEGVVEEVKEKAHEVAGVARNYLVEGTGRVRQFVIEKPAMALGLGLGLGVFLGWLIKRR